MCLAVCGMFLTGVVCDGSGMCGLEWQVERLPRVQNSGPICIAKESTNHFSTLPHPSPTTSHTHTLPNLEELGKVEWGCGLRLREELDRNIQLRDILCLLSCLLPHRRIAPGRVVVVREDVDLPCIVLGSAESRACVCGVGG